MRARHRSLHRQTLVVWSGPTPLGRTVAYGCGLREMQFIPRSAGLIREET